ncbi:hypothetical protein FOL47_008375 [Perkinsus chesapeaki]|uniref:Uncharacterized protein n=1 Tax=Perkinsus chesapeaki TaxID=330153 RepID=A0A7J6LEH5_PERCH|nr:hypothetical protein FOL47_008375 [Perkinsus chesapeaki]
MTHFRPPKVAVDTIEARPVEPKKKCIYCCKYYKPSESHEHYRASTREERLQQSPRDSRSYAPELEALLKSKADDVASVLMELEMSLEEIRSLRAWHSDALERETISTVAESIDISPE